MKTSFYSQSELKSLGIKAYGKNVLISKKASFYNPSQISLGHHVRIDDFCLLSGNITIGSYIHISAYCALYGGGSIIVKDFSGLSARVTIYSLSDDFSGQHLIGPLVLQDYTQVKKAKVILNQYCQVGAGSVILPGVTLGTGAVAGAMSLVKQNLKAWTINVGIPAKFLKKRKKDLMKLSQQLLQSNV